MAPLVAVSDAALSDAALVGNRVYWYKDAAFG
jgi:hypothetical protein